MTPSNRRGFLRGLASLPLIGGSVALIGSPVRAAVAATDDQLAQYRAFVWTEFLHTTETLGWEGRYPLRHCLECYGPALPARSDLAQRAPVILSAAGVPLV